jgi:hypothetical protein
MALNSKLPDMKSLEEALEDESGGGKKAGRWPGIVHFFVPNMTNPNLKT